MFWPGVRGGAGWSQGDQDLKVVERKGLREACFRRREQHAAASKKREASASEGCETPRVARGWGEREAAGPGRKQGQIHLARLSAVSVKLVFSTLA